MSFRMKSRRLLARQGLIHARQICAQDLVSEIEKAASTTKPK